MELVYLWVEDYKNIHKQGFNFSSKFECTYDEEKNGLTINENKNHLKNFFGENINVTAIVGENGSGKSSIVKFIFMLIFYNQFNNSNQALNDASNLSREEEEALKLEYKNIQSNHNYKGFLILYDGSSFYKVSMRIDTFSKNNLYIGVPTIFNNKAIDLLQIEPEKINFYNIHFNYMLDTLKDDSDDTFIDTIYHKSDAYETSLLLEPYKRVDNKEQIDINNLEYLSQQKFANIFRLGIKNKFIEIFFNPNLVKISINIEKILNKIDLLSANVIGNPLLVIDNTNSIPLSNKNHLFHHTNPYDVKQKVKALLINKNYLSLNKLYIALKILEKNYHRKFENFKDIYSSFFESSNSEKTIENTIQKVTNIQSTIITTLTEAKIPYFEIQKLINSINFESKILDKKDEEAKLAKNLDKKVHVSLINKLLINVAPWMDIEYFEDKKSYKSLSSGEKTLFSFMIHLMYQVNNLKDSKYKQINLFLDETELGLHPQWQKLYIKYILMTLEDFSIKIHLIFITHSPFILSDLPKENVIFLKEGKQVEVDINPFGANIHTLLSHGFFMQDGLMGEFAKNKIEDVINYLNDKESSIKNNDEAQRFLNIIGEPVIKNQLQKMLDSKRLSKVDEVNQKIKDMEYDLMILKQNQNKHIQDELNDRAKKRYTQSKNDDK